MKKFFYGCLGVAFVILVLDWFADLDQQNAKEVLDSLLNWDALKNWY
ncbi:hypothetical protein [Oceanobacillus sp. FSL W7-1309]